MVFSSSTFLLLFLPLGLSVYFLMPNRASRNVWLLAISLVFYAWGEPVYILLMLASIAANYFFARAIDGARDGVGRRVLLWLCIAFNCAVIGFFKYEGFVAENINMLFGVRLVPDLQLPLPIGISFYTLQALSYVIDVYRREVGAQRNILYLGMYIACFPQLIAGPIVRYQTIHDQILNRKENLSDFVSGLRLFVVGLCKKVLLANTIAILAEQMLSAGGPTIGLVGAWSGIVAYSFQIFFDFSGYSDMAIGLGRMMGFSYLRNFNYPYISQSITEFWRRWHISLSTFFRDYIYIPLGGSRVSTLRWVFNIAVVWAITGLWHGAAWNYIGWGVYYGVLLILEKLVLGRLIERLPAVLRHLYVILVFVFGWTFFWITDTEQLVLFWQAMVGMYGTTGTNTIWQLQAWSYLPVFVVCAVASVPLAPWLKERFCAWAEERIAVSVLEHGTASVRHVHTDNLCVFDIKPATKTKAVLVQVAGVVYDLCLIVLFCASIASVVSGSFNPFIYFQF